jgi:hypothetical protein
MELENIGLVIVVGCKDFVVEHRDLFKVRDVNLDDMLGQVGRGNTSEHFVFIFENPPLECVVLGGVEFDPGNRQPDFGACFKDVPANRNQQSQLRLNRFIFRRPK